MDNPKGGRVAWVESWYNADWNNDLPASPYIPYKNMKKKNSQKTINDFRKIYNYPSSMFESDMKAYRQKFFK